MIKLNKKIADDIIELLKNEVDGKKYNSKSLPFNCQTPENDNNAYMEMLRATKLINNYKSYIYGIHVAVYELRNYFGDNEKSKNHLSPLISKNDFNDHFWIDKFMANNINISRIVENIDIIEETNNSSIILNRLIRLIIISDKHLIKPLKSMFVLKKKVDVLDFKTGLNSITRLISFARGINYSIEIIMNEIGVSFKDLDWRFPYHKDECKLIMDSLNSMELEINKELDLCEEKIGFDFSLIG